MKTKLQYFCILLVSFTGIYRVAAQIPFTNGIINVDLYYYTIYPAYGPGAAAIGSPGDVWNQVLWPTYPGEVVSGLQNNSGTVTTAGLKFENASGNGGSPSGTYGALFDDYETFSSNAQIDQITGLTPNAQYQLYLYDPNGSTLSVNGTSFSSTVPPRPQDSLVLGTGYSMNVVTADGSGNLNISAPSGSGSFSAMQLTPATPPAPLLAIALSSTSSLTTNASGVFSLPATYPVENPPICVVAFSNVDGRVDLASVSQGANTLTVLTNNGSGGYGMNTNFNTRNRPYAITAADVNGDGSMDLIYCSINDGTPGSGNNGTLTVLTNDGSGNFVSNATYGVGSYPVSVTTADVNNDGKPDLICANFGNYEQGSLSVLTNDGSGGFVTAATLNAGDSGGFGPLSVTVADINKDGWLDLICVNDGAGGLGNTLLVFTNNGSGGGFSPASQPVVGTGPVSVTAADVNNDGWMDLICANNGNNGSTLTVLTNNHSGGFVLSSSPVVGVYPTWVVAADVNGDGWTDIICAVPNNGLVELTNNESGGFGLAANISLSGAACVVTADINGDGGIDLASTTGSSSLAVLTNTPVVLTNTINGVTVSWPSPSTGWTLQQNSDLGTTNWSTNSLPILDNGTNKSIKITPPVGNLFFRLQSQ